MKNIPLESAKPLFLLIGALLAASIVVKTCTSSEIAPVDPADMAAFADAARDAKFGCSGIWPHANDLKDARKINKSIVPGLEKWLGCVLNESLHPENDQWGSEEWVLVSKFKLRRHSDYLLGYFASRNEEVSRIEFQQTIQTMNLTIISQSLFPNENFREKEIQDLLGELLEIPKDVISNMEVDLRESRLIAVGEEKIALTAGRILDARHKVPFRDAMMGMFLSSGAKFPKIPENNLNNQDPEFGVSVDKREWFSPMGFWIAKGRLCVTFSTRDWKGGDRSPSAIIRIKSNDRREIQIKPNK